MRKFFAWLWVYLRPFTNWRFLICFGISWIITNGMWYVIALAPLDLPDWLVWIARGYLMVLYWPITPEKFFLTIPFAIYLLTKLFKNHPKTRKQLDDMYAQAKSDWQKVKFKFREFIRKIKIKIAIIKQRKMMKKGKL